MESGSDLRALASRADARRPARSAADSEASCRTHVATTTADARAAVRAARRRSPARQVRKRPNDRGSRAPLIYSGRESPFKSVHVEKPLGEEQAQTSEELRLVRRPRLRDS